MYKEKYKSVIYPIEKKCQYCNNIFLVYNKNRLDNAIYCSSSCACKSRRESGDLKRKTPYPTGDKSYNYKGGSINSQGYKLIRVPGHPHAQKSGYIREHRIVMEKHLGRYLLPTEDVHHINENKLDNRIENLELLESRSEHIRKYHYKEISNNQSSNL